MSKQENTALANTPQNNASKSEENKPSNPEGTPYNPLKQLYPSHVSFSTPLRSCLKNSSPKSQYDKISSSFPPSKMRDKSDAFMNLSNNHASAEKPETKKVSYSDTRPIIESKPSAPTVSSLPSYDQHLINTRSSGNQWATNKSQNAAIPSILTEQLNGIRKSPATHNNNEIPSKMKKLKKKKKKEKSDSDIDQKIKALKEEIFSKSNLNFPPNSEEEFLKRKKSVTIVEPPKDETSTYRSQAVRGSLYTNEPQPYEVFLNKPNQDPHCNKTAVNNTPNDEKVPLNFSPNNQHFYQNFQYDAQENFPQQISRTQLIKQYNLSQQKLKHQQASQQLKEIQEQLQVQLQVQLQRQVEQQQLQQLLKQKQDQILHQQLQQQLKQHEQIQKQQQLQIIQQLQMQQKLLQQSSQQRQIEQQQKLQEYQQQLLEILKQNQSKKENLEQKSLHDQVQQQLQQHQHIPNSTWQQQYRDDSNSLTSLLRDQKNVAQFPRPQANSYLSELLSPVSYHSTLPQGVLPAPTLVNSSANSLIPLQILSPNNIQPLVHTPTTLQLAPVQANSQMAPSYRLVPSIQQTIPPLQAHYSIAQPPNQLQLINASPLVNQPIAYQPLQNHLANDFSLLYNTQNNNNNNASQSYEAMREEGSLVEYLDSNIEKEASFPNETNMQDADFPMADGYPPIEPPSFNIHKSPNENNDAGVGTFDVTKVDVGDRLQEVLNYFGTLHIGSPHVQLWQFLLELLADPGNYSDLIVWEGGDGEFRMVDPEGLARKWGKRKRRQKMNFDKMGRAMRYYYEKMILKKVSGKKSSYRFILTGILCQGKKALQDAFEKFKKENGFCREHVSEHEDCSKNDDFYNIDFCYQNTMDDGFDYTNNLDELFEYVHDDAYQNSGMHFSPYNQTQFAFKETCIPVC